MSILWQRSQVKPHLHQHIRCRNTLVRTAFCGHLYRKHMCDSTIQTIQHSGVHDMTCWDFQNECSCEAGYRVGVVIYCSLLVVRDCRGVGFLATRNPVDTFLGSDAQSW